MKPRKTLVITGNNVNSASFNEAGAMKPRKTQASDFTGLWKN